MITLRMMWNNRFEQKRECVCVCICVDYIEKDMGQCN